MRTAFLLKTVPVSIIEPLRIQIAPPQPAEELSVNPAWFRIVLLPSESLQIAPACPAASLDANFVSDSVIFPPLLRIAPLLSLANRFWNVSPEKTFSSPALMISHNWVQGKLRRLRQSGGMFVVQEMEYFLPPQMSGGFSGAIL